MIKGRSEKGITLLGLTVYIIAILISIGILATINSFFYGNIFVIKDIAKYSAEFDKFNSYIIADVKNNNKVAIQNGSIIFEDGTTYVYNYSDMNMYRGNVKIAGNIRSFSASKKTITVNNVDKDILMIRIIIGNSSISLVDKRIDYTLKYW